MTRHPATWCRTRIFTEKTARHLLRTAWSLGMLEHVTLVRPDARDPAAQPALQ